MMANTHVLGQELTQVLNGLKALPTIRQEAIDKISKKINIEKVEAIFSLQKGMEILTEKETSDFLSSIYQVTKDERFNTKSYDFFQVSFKQQFLREKKYRKDNADNIRIIFSKTAEIERKYNIDIYEMNKVQFEEILVKLEAKTLRSLQNYISKIKQYIDYAIEVNKTKDSNIALNYDTKSKVEKFIDKNAEDNMIFNMQDIMEMADFADNPQDGVILALIFDGLSYRDKYSELVNLTEENIDFDSNTINLPERIEGDRIVKARTIEMSPVTSKLVDRAINVPEYLSINGDNSREYTLQESNFILRGFRKGREQINWRNINQRIIRIKEINEEEFLNATTTSYSGQLHFAKKLLNEGIAIESVVEKILVRFGMPTNTSSRFYLRSRIEKYASLTK